MPPSSAAPVVITFSTEGWEALRGVFDTVEQRMVQFDRTTGRAAEQGARQRVQSTRTEVDQREKEYQKLVRDEEKYAKDSVKTAERAAKQKVAVEKVAAKEKERVQEQTTRALARLVSEEVRDVERAEKQKQQAIAKTAGEERSMRARYGRAAGRNVMSGIGSLAGMATGALAMGLSVGGGFAVANAARKEMSFERTVAQTSNMAYIPGTTTRAEVSPEVIKAMSEKTEGLTNIGKEDIAKGISRYVGLSSDFKGLAGKTSSGKTGLEELAILSKASGTGFETLLEGAASIKVNNQGMNADQLLGNVRAMLGGGKQGSVPLDVLAPYIGEAQSTASSFTGSGTTEGLARNQAQLLGLVQLAGTKTGGDAARAAMAIKDFSGDVMREGIKSKLMTAKDIYEGGDPNKGLLAPAQLLENVFKRTHGREDLEQKIMGQRTMPLMRAINAAYVTAETEKKGSGIETVHNRIAQFTDQSYLQSDVKDEFNRVMDTHGERISKAWNVIENSLEEKAIPFLEKFATALTDHTGDITNFLDSLAAVANFMVEHPWQTMFMAMEAELVAAIGKAMISQTIKEAFAGNLSKGINASIPQVTLAIAGLALALQAGIAAINEAVEKDKDKESKTAGDVARSGYLAAKIKAGHASPAEIEEEKKLAAKMGKTVAGERESLVSPTSSARGFFGATEKAFTGGSVISDQMMTEYKQHSELLKEIRDALKSSGGTPRPMTGFLNTKGGAVNDPTSGPPIPNHGSSARSDTGSDSSRGGQRGGG